MQAIFDAYAQAINLDEQKITEIFTFAKGWEGKYRQIMQLGKQLPALPDENKQDEYLVKGCESQVWLHHAKDAKGCFHFAADSDARIVKGLVVIVLSAFDGKTAEQIAQFDIQNYFATLDLLKHLSPSRSNGIHAIVEEIKKL